MKTIGATGILSIAKAGRFVLGIVLYLQYLLELGSGPKGDEVL